MANYYPIIYVRGYAMTQSEVESTFNMPYYGFNLGSTQFKLAAGTEPQMHIFESPVVRLLKEENYQDSFGRFVDPHRVERHHPRLAGLLAHTLRRPPQRCPCARGGAERKNRRARRRHSSIHRLSEHERTLER